VTLQLPRSHLFMLFALLTVLLGVGFGIAQSPSVNLTLPWHQLQQVAKGAADTTSVDASGNNIIDEADLAFNALRLNNSDPSDWCRVGDTRSGCASSGGGTGAVQDVALTRCTTTGQLQRCPCPAAGLQPIGLAILVEKECTVNVRSCGSITSTYIQLCAKK